MKSSDVLIAKIKSMEGLKLKTYLDSVKVPTIGYGHTRGVKLGDTCTAAQAEEFLRQDIAPDEVAVTKIVTVPLTQGQFDACVDFCFNLGIGNFSHSTLLKLVNDSKFEEAAAEFAKWNLAGGKVLPGLTARRDWESKRFLSLV